MAIPDIASFNGAITLTAFTGCTLTFNATITQVSLERIDKETMIGTYTFVSDGDPTSIVWDETGSANLAINGLNAAVSMPSGFNLGHNAWTATVDVDPIEWSKFVSYWKNNKPGNASINGTVSGVVEYDNANTEPMASV
jgi:hypothetical protein